ncbi:MAG: hypothetical protein SVY53_12450 [Chloroflexota bacterium]|nr:hypothetical protein [Chloroflexota bacterium]
MDYTHSPIGEEVEAIGGSYIIDTEDCLTYEGKQVLYLIGGTGFMRSCCSPTLGLRYISVPGFVKNWQHKKNADGHPVSDIEPIKDDTMRKTIRKTLSDLYNITNIEFW